MSTEELFRTTKEMKKDEEEPFPKRKRGRPKGSGNKAKEAPAVEASEDSASKARKQEEGKGKKQMVDKIASEKESSDSPKTLRKSGKKKVAAEYSAKVDGREWTKTGSGREKRSVEATRSPILFQARPEKVTKKTPVGKNQVSMEEEKLVGCKIKMWWPLDKQFYKGSVISYDAKKHKHKILYDDGEIEHLLLANEKFEIADNKKALKKTALIQLDSQVLYEQDRSETESETEFELESDMELDLSEFDTSDNDVFECDPLDLSRPCAFELPNLPLPWNPTNCIGDEFSVQVFAIVWKSLGQLFKQKQMFALRWVLRNEDCVDAFVTSILNINCNRKIKKGLLYNGYTNAKKMYSSLFDQFEWKILESIFEEHIFHRALAKPINWFVKCLRDDNLCSYLEEVIIDLRRKNRFSMAEYEVVLLKNNFTAAKKTAPKAASKVKIGTKTLTKATSKVKIGTKLEPLKEKGTVKRKPVKKSIYEKCFLGDWSDEDVITHKDHNLSKFPTEFFVAKTEKNATFFYDKSASEPILVAMLMKPGKHLPEDTKAFIRAYMVDLFMAHPMIVRKQKPSITGHMTAYGPFYHVYKGETDKDSFYTHRLKLFKMFEHCGAARQFDEVLDKYSHNDMVDIILGLYFWLCPEMLRVFFNYSNPYLRPDQYDKTPLERYLKLGGPNLYQLFITKDYVSRVHRDKDAVDFSLLYCSHPDGSTSPPVDFVMVDYGLRLAVGDAYLLAFRSSLNHCSANREPTSNAAFVGCVTVNSRLHSVLQRHQATIFSSS